MTTHLQPVAERDTQETPTCRPTGACFSRCISRCIHRHLQRRIRTAKNDKDADILHDKNITGFISFVERRPLPPPSSWPNLLGVQPAAACSRHGMAATIPRRSRIMSTRDGDKDLANQPPKQNESPSTSRLRVHPRLQPANDGPIRVPRPAPAALAIAASRQQRPRGRGGRGGREVASQPASDAMDIRGRGNAGASFPVVIASFYPSQRCDGGCRMARGGCGRPRPEMMCVFGLLTKEEM